jgi:hypothetical protein
MWFVFYLVGQAYVFFQVMGKIEEAKNTPAEKRISEGWWVPTVNAIHFVLPRTSDLNILTSKLLRSGLITGNQIMRNEVAEIETVSWGESLAVSLGFIAVMLFLACWRFRRKDY